MQCYARVLPVTIHLKTLQIGYYAWCYAFTLLHAFAWSLHLPNTVVTTKLSKNSEYK